MENKTESTYKHLYGLVGRNISYSLSRAHFAKKFDQEHIPDSFYTNFDIQDINEFPSLITDHPNLAGMNVTIPYKEAVIPFLDELDETAEAIGAVNVIQLKGNRLIGHNSDYYGFQKSLEPHLKQNHKKALILGTGGASKAVAFALKKLNINFKYVSRNPKLKQFAYSDLNKEIVQSHTIIINTTPLGTFPNVNDKPEIPYKFINENHLLFDLIYNPEETTFLKLGKKNGAAIMNGEAMFEFQAAKAWEIWHAKL